MDKLTNLQNYAEAEKVVFGRICYSDFQSTSKLSDTSTA